MKTFKLCVDGKKLNVSFSQVDDEVYLFRFEDKPTLNVSSSQVDGEVNLFRLEDNPTLNDNRDKLQHGQVLIKDIDDILMNLQRRDNIYIYISEIHSEQNLL